MNKKINNLDAHVNRLVQKAKRMPRTINEAMENYSDDDMETFSDNDEEPEPEQRPEPKACDSITDGSGVVATIRKTALKAMAQLADCAESEDYQTLKKIFLLCDNMNSKKDKPEQAQ